MNYEDGLKMARLMQAKNPEILQAIHRVTADQHGVVELWFRRDPERMDIEIADAPFEPNVRVYSWEPEEGEEEMGG